MKIKFFNRLRLIAIGLIAMLFISCGKDYTSDYQKLKKELEAITSEKAELNEKNAKLKGENLEKIKLNQNSLIANYITGILKSIDAKNPHTSTYVNIMEEGKLIKTIVRDCALTFNPSKGVLPFNESVYVHTTNDKGIITQSKSENTTINWGWDNQNCVSIIVEKNDLTIKLSIDKQGFLTKIESELTQFNYKYNEQNLLIEKTNIVNEAIAYKETYNYNSDNKLTKVSLFSEEKLTEEKLYTYDSDKSTVEIKRYNSDNIYDTRTFHYNINGDLIKLIYLIPNKTKKTYEITYNEGLLSSYKSNAEYYNTNGVITGGSKVILSDIKIDKDIQGLKVEETYVTYNNSFFKKYRHKTYTLNNGEYVVQVNIEVTRLGKDKNYQLQNKKTYHKNDELFNEENYVEYYNEYPFAPKKRTVKTFNEDGSSTTLTQLNNINNGEYPNWQNIENK